MPNSGLIVKHLSEVIRDDSHCTYDGLIFHKGGKINLKELINVGHKNFGELVIHGLYIKGIFLNVGQLTNRYVNLERNVMLTPPLREVSGLFRDEDRIFYSSDLYTKNDLVNISESFSIQKHLFEYDLDVLFHITIKGLLDNTNQTIELTWRVETLMDVSKNKIFPSIVAFLLDSDTVLFRLPTRD